MNIKELFAKKHIQIIAIALAATVLVAAAIVTAVLVSNPRKDDVSSDSLPSSSETEIISSDISSEVSSEEEKKLAVTSHKNTDTTTTNPFTVFSGSSDPAFPLLLNGVELERDEAGNFTTEQQLKIGANNFTFSHKGVETTYIVRYRYVVIKSCSPASAKSFSSGSSFTVTVVARKGSTVTAEFNGQKITLKASEISGGDEEARDDETFTTYSGSFTLPGDNLKKLSLGKVKFAAVCGEHTETAQSGSITVNAVKTQTVGEVVAFSAETFDGGTSDDASRPTNNYFPKGTVDYVVGKTYYGEKEYLILRCGRRIYVDKKIVPGGGKSVVSKEYVGKLPDTNSLSVASLKADKRLTTLTLNTEWKAPFFLDVLPQSYSNPKTQDYKISSFTANYVDITFCYATKLEGAINIGDYNPVFKSAEIINAGSNTVLRLHLRKTGGFYGWDASYNSAGQLVFTFLHPVQVKPAANAYGADLSGVKILLDVGHGGIDVGATSLNGKVYESERNLALALALKSELEKTGATVIMNRNADTTVTADTRCQNLKNQAPDLCIAIHHDSNASSRPNGFGSFYSTPFSYLASRFVYNRTIATGIYNASAVNNRNRCEWHYYYVARMSNCPVVLTENGFMSNANDLSHIISAASVSRKAAAIAQGAADYFLSIRQDLPVPPPSSEPSSSSSQPEASSSSKPASSSSIPESSSATETSSSSSEQSSSSRGDEEGNESDNTELLPPSPGQPDNDSSDTTTSR